MAQREPTAAASIYPHLASGTREPIKQAEPSLANALYPGPRSQPAQPKSDWQDWSGVDPGLARMVGLIPKGWR
jgi:hypothetical protein